MSNIMVKTAIFGMAGLCLLKVIAEAQPQRVHAAGFQEKIGSVANQMNDIYDNKDQSLQNLKKNLYNSGSDASQKVQDMYDDAYKKVVDAKSNLDANINKEDKKGKFWATSESKDELQKKYDDAKDVFENLKNSLNEYTNGASAEGIADKVQGIIGKAQDFAAEKYNTFTEDKLNSNIEYYNKQAAVAKKEWDDTKSSWLKWRKAQSKEIQDKAESKYYYFKEKNEDAVDQLINYLKKNGQDTKEKLNEINKQAKEYAKKAKDQVLNAGYDIGEKANQHVHHAKNYANDARERMASVGYDAKENIEDNAEYAKNKAAGLKDRVAQAGYNAKENIEDNAEYAQHKAAGIKDRVTQAGYDAKENIEDNAEYAKNKAAGLKDRVAQAGYNAKENIEDNAEYAQHKAAGIKDRLAQAGFDTKDKIAEDADFVKDQTGGYVSGAKNWIGRTGSFIKDQYNSMWNSLGVFHASSKEIAEDAVKYYDEQVALAKKEYDQTQSSWFRWRKAESQEIQDRAKENFEIMKARSDAAKEELKRWTNKFT